MCKKKRGILEFWLIIEILEHVHCWHPKMSIASGRRARKVNEWPSTAESIQSAMDIILSVKKKSCSSGIVKYLSVGRELLALGVSWGWFFGLKRIIFVKVYKVNVANVSRHTLLVCTCINKKLQLDKNEIGKLILFNSIKLTTYLIYQHLFPFIDLYSNQSNYVMFSWSLLLFWLLLRLPHWRNAKMLRNQ